ncbi:MAG: hypothetical protein EAY65_03660 [Alphaproteobacteria bacterium]|nr:MAG: hypothetical protein EAY65_03660 [Alphaproteobacteria bacterium]
MNQQNETIDHSPCTKSESSIPLLPLVLGMSASALLASVPVEKIMAEKSIHIPLNEPLLNAVPWVKTGASIASVVCAIAIIPAALHRLREESTKQAYRERGIPLTYLDASPEVIHEGRIKMKERAQAVT